MRSEEDLPLSVQATANVPLERLTATSASVEAAADPETLASSERDPLAKIFRTKISSFPVVPSIHVTIALPELSQSTLGKDQSSPVSPFTTIGPVQAAPARSPSFRT